MADKRLVLRFSEEMYATKEDVKRELRLSLVDNFWNDILDYRENFMRPLALYDAEQKSLYLTMCGLVQNQVNQIERKLSKNMMQYNKNKHLRFSSYFYLGDKLDFDILKRYAEVKGIDIDDDTIIKLLSPHPVPTYERHMRLARFNETLKLVKNSYLSPIDEDYLANIYSIISNDTELTQLYRDTNFDNPGNRFIIDRIYESAPVYAIVPMMNLLIKFINESQCGVTIKACAVFYYFNYVKPFFAYNEELALLLTKAVIAKSEVGDVAFTLNLERLLSDLKERVEKVCIEVQKTNDLTYMLKLFIHLFNECIEKEISRMNNLQAISLKEEYYFEAKQEAKKSPYYHENEKLDSVKEIDECDLKQEKIIKQENVNNEKESIKIQPQEEQKIELDKEYSGLAISSLPPVLDEKEAARLEEHLLESDPELTRSQAYFYARHCTMGKRYTIQQFKKEVGSAYETARTSMDKLVELGFYRKESRKNKFIYVPVKRN